METKSVGLWPWDRCGVSLSSLPMLCAHMCSSFSITLVVPPRPWWHLWPLLRVELSSRRYNMGKETSFQTPGTVWGCPCGCGRVSGGNNELLGGGLFAVSYPHPGLHRPRGRYSAQVPSPHAHALTWPWVMPCLILLVNGLRLQQEIRVPDHHHHVPKLWAKGTEESAPSIPLASELSQDQGQGPSTLEATTLALAALRVSSSIQSSSSRR